VFAKILTQDAPSLVLMGQPPFRLCWSEWALRPILKLRLQSLQYSPPDLVYRGQLETLQAGIEQPKITNVASEQGVK